MVYYRLLFSFIHRKIYSSTDSSSSSKGSRSTVVVQYNNSTKVDSIHTVKQHSTVVQQYSSSMQQYYNCNTECDSYYYPSYFSRLVQTRVFFAACVRAARC